MNKQILTLSLITLFMMSCANVTQKDWHIKTIELADEYFPKYFEAIENFLQKNNIQYIKEYSEEFDNHNHYKNKNYICIYHISENVNFNFQFKLQDREGTLLSEFYYEMTTETEILNFPQCYINVMIDVVNFCSYNFMDTGEMYNDYYNNVKEKYRNYEIDDKFGNYFKISSGENYEDLLPMKGITLYYTEEEYNLSIYLWDYLTDVNIWNK